MQLWAVIVDGLRDSMDRKIFWVLIGMSVLIALVMVCIGFEEDRVSFMFGLAEIETSSLNPLTLGGRSQIMGYMIHGVLDLFMGWIGLTLMIIATAGMVPTLLEHGAIDVVLAKPISRTRLFLYKYVAGLVFVVVQASIFVGLTFIVMGLRWGVWSPGYLMCIPLLVLLFSYLYCVSVLVGVRTRSAVASILITLSAWVVFSLISQAPAVFELLELQDRPLLYRSVKLASWIPPKTADLPLLAARFTGGATSAELVQPAIDASESATATDREQLSAAARLEREQMNAPLVYSIGSSLAFEVVVLALAVWSFVRHDY